MNHERPMNESEIDPTCDSVESSARRGWEQMIEIALAEDIGGGDITTLATVDPAAFGRGTIFAKARGVISGIDAAAAVFHRVDPAVEFRPALIAGGVVQPDTLVATVAGSAVSLLAAERVALNLLQRLSGVATITAQYVEAVAGTSVRIVDTRKTTPGWRALEKAAVRHGGGQNHRFNLNDGVLIKDNHLAAVGGSNRVGRAVALARQRAPHTLRIEVEVTTLDEVRQALEAGAEIILLDNMTVDQMRAAVELIQGKALVEASGGVSLATVQSIAATGVDLISVGALTHSAPALDLSLNFSLDNVPADSDDTNTSQA